MVKRSGWPAGRGERPERSFTRDQDEVSIGTTAYLVERIGGFLNVRDAMG